VLANLVIGVPSPMVNMNLKISYISIPTTRQSPVRNIFWRDTALMDIDASISTENSSVDPNSETLLPRSMLIRNYTSLPSWSSFPRMRLFWPDFKNFTKESVKRNGLLMRLYRSRGNKVLITAKRKDFPFSKQSLLKIIPLSNLIPVVLLPSTPLPKILISS